MRPEITLADQVPNVANDITTETVKDRIEQLNNRIDAIEEEFINENNNVDNTNDISASIANYRNSERRIAEIESDMDEQYGTRLRTGLQ